MTETALFACRGVRDARWQLGTVPDDRDGWTLLGWREAPESPDAGVPDSVARVLAATFASVARVTFPSSEEPAEGAAGWVTYGERHVRTLTPGRLTGVIQSALKRAPRHIVLVSTRDPDAIARLFDDGRYPWWLQGTFVLLSDPDSGPPDIDSAAVRTLLDGPTLHDLDVADTAINAVVRPGVDGDVAGVLSRVRDVEQQIIDAAAQECARRGFGWAVVPEEDLITRLG